MVFCGADARDDPLLIAKFVIHSGRQSSTCNPAVHYDYTSEITV